MTPRITPLLARAYRQTTYRAAGIDFRIGCRSPRMDALLRAHRVRAAVFITAHNPFSRRMPAGWNARAQARLANMLRNSTILFGCGTWRGWSEDHLLVLGPIAPAARLARRYRQNGIVILRLGQLIRLLATS